MAVKKAYVVLALAAAGTMALATGPAAAIRSVSGDVGPVGLDEAPTEVATAPATAPAINREELISKAVKWLGEQQHKDGSWAQGEESAQMGHGLDAVKDKGNVGDTCMATLALIRAGSTPKAGANKDKVIRGIEFVCGEVEKADADSLSVTSVNGTRIQSKLGTHVDTFLASLLLGEVRNQMPDDVSKKRVVAALDKVLNKIEKNQKADGSFAQSGWATDLAQGLAARGVNRAVQNGAKVDEKTLAALEDNARKRIDGTGKASVGGGSAGVALYASGSTVGSLQVRDETYKQQIAKAEGDLAAAKAQPAATTPARIEQMERTAAELKTKAAANAADLTRATNAVAEQVKDDRFVAGFGSNGGEEFLSYLHLGEALQAKGGDEWKKWEEKMAANLQRVQNADGSWSGHHCITGRTFCTSAATMVLTIDKAPAMADKIKGK